MAVAGASAFFIFLLFGFAMVQINNGTPLAPDAPATDVTCKEAQANAGKVKEGMREREVVALLGKPDNIENGVWAYNFWECRPPIKPGMQIILGIALTFEDKAVSKIDYATMCAAGSAPNVEAPQRKRRRGK